MDAEITVIGRIIFNDHSSMYRLSNGLIVHREDSSKMNARGDMRYKVCIPGASKGGAAKVIGFDRTLNGAIRKASR